MSLDRERWRRNSKARLKRELAIAEFHRPGARLILNHASRTKDRHRIEPSGLLVDDATSKILKSLPGVTPGSDGLFRETSQTWHIEERRSTND
jgi:hypothetical protein